MKKTKALALMFALACAATLAAPRVLSAQAAPTQARGSEVSLFGGFSLSSGDFFTQTRATGGTFGADYTRFYAFPLAPGLEVRADLSHSPSATEHSVLFGLRGQIVRVPPVAPLHPYVDVLVGPGTLTFTHPTGNYTGDSSTVISYGGGVEVNVWRGVAVKVDYQRQHWNTGEVALQPGVLTLGAAWRPFAGWRHR